MENENSAPKHAKLLKIFGKAATLTDDKGKEKLESLLQGLLECEERSEAFYNRIIQKIIG